MQRDNLTESWVEVYLQGGVFVTIDRELFEAFMTRSWIVTRKRGRVRIFSLTKRNEAYQSVSLGQWVLGRREGFEVGFVNDANPFDYRATNLRHMKRSERQVKLAKSKKSFTSKFKGVS